MSINLEQFDMFTPAGNAAVYEIVKRYEGREVTRELWIDLMSDIVDLSGKDGFKEAQDTAVREGIWRYLKGDL